MQLLTLIKIQSYVKNRNRFIFFMRTRLLLAENPFPECSDYAPLTQTKLSSNSFLCFQSSSNVLFQTYVGMEIHASIWDSSKNQYKSPLQLKSGNNAVSCTNPDHPAYYKIINTEANQEFNITFTEFLTSSGNTENYYASLEAINNFELVNSKDKTVTLTYMNSQLDYSIKFNNDNPISKSVFQDGINITSPHRVTAAITNKFNHFRCVSDSDDQICKVAITINEINCSKFPTNCDRLAFIATFPKQDRIFNFNQDLIDNTPMIKDNTIKIIIIVVVVLVVVLSIIIGIVCCCKHCLCCKICRCCTKCCCYYYRNCRKVSDSPSEEENENEHRKEHGNE